VSLKLERVYVPHPHQLQTVRLPSKITIQDLDHNLKTTELETETTILDLETGLETKAVSWLLGLVETAWKACCMCREWLCVAGCWDCSGSRTLTKPLDSSQKLCRLTTSVNLRTKHSELSKYRGQCHS